VEAGKQFRFPPEGEVITPLSRIERVLNLN
jgi:hypothetical protein